jgi:HAD superfamily hydrolase (TIGR01509 family)
MVLPAVSLTRSPEHSGIQQIGKRMNPVTIVAFDCDGVMFNSEKANTAYYNRILNHLGRPALSREQFAFVHMHTVDEALAHLLPHRDMLEEAHRFRKETGYFEFIRLMEIEPGLKDLLRDLRPRIKTAVATNRTDTMPHVLKEHELVGTFDLVVCALDVLHPKPHPEMLEKILTHFGAAPDEMLYVGDSQLDALAARAAGTPFAAYRNRDLEADYHITRLLAIKDILNGHP